MHSSRIASSSAMIEPLETRLQFDGGVTIIVGSPSASIYSKPVAYSAKGKGPQGIATGDFNRDGRQDVAFANYGSNSVGIMLNNGSGGFNAPIVYTGVISAPTSMVASDLNGDGKLDLAISGSDVVFMLGKGNGQFNGATHIAVGKKPYTIVAGDFNKDGRPDLATSNFLSNNVSVMLNRGLGRFFAPVYSSGGNGPAGLVSADFTGDGKLDLAVTDMGDNGTGGGTGVRVLRGNGNGTFVAGGIMRVGSRPSSIATGDLNKDGKLDLVTANGGMTNTSESDNSVSVLMGLGGGSFGARSSFATGGRPTSVVLGDFNSDKRLDVLVTNYSGNTISLLKGNNSGSLSTVESVSGATGNISLATADFNRDGKLDIVSAGFISGTVVLYTHK